MLSEIQDLARRLEQQLTTYERMHADELKRFQEQWDALQRVQRDELQMLRDELNQLKQELDAYKESEASPSVDVSPKPQPVEMAITRRELLTGSLPFSDKRA